MPGQGLKSISGGSPDLEMLNTINWHPEMEMFDNIPSMYSMMPMIAPVLPN